MIRAYWEFDFGEPAHQGQSGSAHAVSSDANEPDPVERLHDVVEEVTGKRPERKAKSIGFLP